MEKKVTRIAHIKQTTDILLIESFNYSASMEKSDAFHGPGTVRNELEYVANERRHKFPEASQSYGFVGGEDRGSYIDHQHGPFTANNFSGQSSSSFPERVMLPAPGSFNSCGHGRFSTPSASNNSSNSHFVIHGPRAIHNEHGYEGRAGPSRPYPAALNGYGFVGNDGRDIAQSDQNYDRSRAYPAASNNSSNSHFVIHGPRAIHNEHGYEGRAGSSRPYPAALNGYGFVGNDGRDIAQSDQNYDRSRAYPAASNNNSNSHFVIHGPRVIHNEHGYEGHAGPSRPYPAALNGYGFVGNDGRDIALSDQNYERSGNVDTNFLMNQRSRLIHKVIQVYKDNTTLYEKHASLFEKRDWLRLGYGKDGSLNADMECPVCRGGIKPSYRTSGSWEFSNMKRHFDLIHPESVKIKPNKRMPLGSLTKKNQTLMASEDEDNESTEVNNKKTEQNETLVETKASEVTEPKLNGPSQASDAVTEKGLAVNVISSSENEETTRESSDELSDLSSTNGSSMSSNDWSSLDSSLSYSSWTDASFRHSNNEKITAQKMEKEKINLRDNTDRVQIVTRKRANLSKGKQRKASPSSSDSSRSYKETAKESKSVKRIKRATQKKSRGNNCNRSKSTKSVKSTEAKKTRVNNEPTPLSSESEADEIVNNEEPTPEEWRGHGVEFSWIKFSQRGKCYPAFIFPELDAEGKKSAQYLTMKGELSDLKHPIECKVNCEELPRKYAQLYAKAFQIFNEKNHTNYQ